MIERWLCDNSISLENKVMKACHYTPIYLPVTQLDQAGIPAEAGPSMQLGNKRK